MDATKSRKDRHLDACLAGAVETAPPGGLDALRFDHQPLPELDLRDLDLSSFVLGRPLAWPFLVGSMTGGTHRAGEINARLARTVAESGCGLALGSLRAAVEDPSILGTYDARASAPGLPLLVGNVGAAQLGDPAFEDGLLRVLARLRADALVVHLNPLQEALQAGGDVAWSGVTERIARLRARVARELGIPVGVKEVGSGFSASAAARLSLAAPDFVEVAGTGGTSFALVEGLAATDPVRARCARTFADWGHDARASVVALRAALPGTPVIASGGLRTGLDLAKALRLGAVAGAAALPLLRAADRGDDALRDELAAFREELRLAMFLTGSRTLEDLRRAPWNGGG